MLVLLFIVSLPAVTSRLYASDEIEYYSFLRSLWFDHDLSFDNEYRYFYDHGIARGMGFRIQIVLLTFFKVLTFQDLSCNVSLMSRLLNGFKIDGTSQQL